MSKWVWFLPIAKRGESNAPRGVPGLSQLCRNWELLLPRKETLQANVLCVRAAKSGLVGVREGDSWQWGGTEHALADELCSPGWDRAVPALWAVEVGPAATHGDITAPCAGADTDSAFSFSREIYGNDLRYGYFYYP